MKQARHRPIMVVAYQMWKRQRLNVRRGARRAQKWEDEKQEIRDFWINLARDVIMSIIEPNIEMCESATFLGADLEMDQIDKLGLARSVWIEMVKAAAEFKPGEDTVFGGWKSPFADPLS